MSSNQTILKGEAMLEDETVALDHPVLVEIVLENFSDREIIITEIRGFSHPKVISQFASAISKILHPNESWPYYIQLIPKKEGTYTFTGEVYYKVIGDPTDKTYKTKLNSIKLTVKSSEIAEENVDVDVSITPAKIKCSPLEEIKLVVRFQNNSKIPILIEKITGLCPLNFIIKQVTQGKSLGTTVTFSDFIISEREKREIQLTLKAPAVSQIGRVQTEFSLMPQIFVRPVTSKYRRVITANPLRITLETTNLPGYVFKENGDVLIKIPAAAELFRSIGVALDSQVNLIREGNSIILAPKTVFTSNDPFEQLKSEVYELLRNKEELYEAYMENKIDSSDYEKRRKIIEREIARLKNSMSRMREIMAPEIALRFSGSSELDFIEDFILEKLSLTMTRDETLRKLMRQLVDEEKTLKNRLRNLTESPRAKRLPKHERESIEERIRSRLEEIRELKDELLSILNT